MEGRGYSGAHNSAQRLMCHNERSLPKPRGGMDIRQGYLQPYVPPVQVSRGAQERNYCTPPRPTFAAG